MFSKTTAPTERLSEWRSFRQLFPSDGDELMVVEQFKNIKFQSRYIDYYTPTNWPGVFEIVNEGYFCQSGVTLILAATLHHLGFIKEKEIVLEVISNHITGQEGLVLNYNNKFFNFVPGTISEEAFVRENSTKFDTHIITVDKLYA